MSIPEFFPLSPFPSLVNSLLYTFLKSLFLLLLHPSYLLNLSIVPWTHILLSIYIFSKNMKEMTFNSGVIE